MRILVIFAWLSLCIALPVIGQSKVYHDTPNPSGGGGNGFPFGNLYGNNWRYQLSVPASSLPGHPARFIEFAFAPRASGVFSVKDFQLRMGHANSTALTSVFAGNYATPPVNMIDIQGGNYTFTATKDRWTPLGVKTGFDHDGKSPIIIEIRYRGHGTAPQGTTSIPSWTSATSSNRVWANASYPSPGPADPYSSPVGWTPRTSGAIRVCLTYISILISLSGNATPGGTVTLYLSSPQDAGKSYQVGSSLGTGPIPIGNRTVGLDFDNLLIITTGGLLPAVFQNYAGLLDGAGKATARARIPDDTRLKGVRIHSAFLTLDAGALNGISNISTTVTFTII